MTPNYQLTDTHTHIYYHANSESLDAQLKHCFAKNVTRLFLPNVDSQSIQPVFDTVMAYPENCFPMLGLHPCSVKTNYKAELKIIEKAISNHQIYAIGEIGLDLYWDKSTLDIQKDAFRTQVNWAKELGLPIDIHCREAFEEIFELLGELKDDKLFGVFHCFTGTLEQAHRAIALGFKLGIGGVVTYKKAGLDHVVKEIELEHIVLETDAPYLAPSPFRGKENESSYLHYIAEKVADLHQINMAELAEITTRNSVTVFGI
ncbi:TatD family deoxyribonuclease [Sphingobacterium alkalisoli]|uniref:TatD family deoxyribonuclease n=1 Tax=Sphingobacterium alkalisoli TaxID=1874115 RepID=A0A4U0GYB4_9SPHI|nr:TatD family hydrolase [Sphingobacterium alkalisoli]TJY64187.1 TatD family deoxyribonuclease [Sphingobacterium alkalisoli]GGH23309.1 TatD family hydrolase [Sphingobacterium alkalisoli]